MMPQPGGIHDCILNKEAQTGFVVGLAFVLSRSAQQD